MPVYQEKDKSKLPKNGYSWYFRTYYSDMYGNRKQKRSKMYQTKTIAKNAENKFLAKTKTEDEIDFEISFKSAYDEWLNVKQQKIKVTGRYDLEVILNKNLVEYFKSYKLHNIKVNQINAYEKWLESKQLTINYANTIIGYFKEFLEYCCIYFDFDKKVANSIVRFRDDNPKKLKDSEINFWTINEFNKFIPTVDDEYYKLIFIFLYRTGLRFGEFRALTWNDINLEKRYIDISKTMSYNSKTHESIITTPKTKNSIRKVDIDDYLYDLIVEYKKKQEKIYGFEEDWYIFGGILPIAPTTLRNNLNKFIDRIEIKKITIHGFRHSHVSLLIYLGCDSRDVAERIGDTVEIVESTYCHMFPEKKKIAVSKLNKLKI